MQLQAHHRASALSLLVALAFGVPTAQAAAPKSVAEAQASVVQVVKGDNDKEQSVAFPVDDRGSFLTTSQAASFTDDLRVIVTGQPNRFKATRIESNASPGLALIRVTGAPKLRPLKIASRRPDAFAPLWAVAPAEVSKKPRGGRAKDLVPLCSEGRKAGLIGISTTRVPGMNGSPVLNRKGEVVGVVRANRTFTGEPACAAVVDPQVLLITERPERTIAVARAARSDFPAVPVVVTIGALLLLVNLAVAVTRRRSLSAAVVTPTGASAPPPEPTTPLSQADDPDDDLGIVLTPSPPSD